MELKYKFNDKMASKVSSERHLDYKPGIRSNC